LFEAITCQVHTLNLVDFMGILLCKYIDLFDPDVRNLTKIQTDGGSYYTYVNEWPNEHEEFPFSINE
jgi:hypothetical protein